MCGPKALVILTLFTLLTDNAAFQVSIPWNSHMRKTDLTLRESQSGQLQQPSNDIDDNLVRAEVDKAIVSAKGNYSPIMVRLAWHSSGTYDKDDKSPRNGGSNGSTMRFEPESTDPANAGLTIPQEVLKSVKHLFPTLSYADLWTLAGVQAIKITGGPEVPFCYGRNDAEDNTTCPAHGRLPEAHLGADHLRQVFYRMGFNDQDIVCLSGAHTLGSCHRNRSGFDGPWTSNPLKFDNEYFSNLLDIEWKPRKWDGPLQYTDPSGQLMMLPSDLALIQDESFLMYVKKYASDEKQFFQDFGIAFSKLIALGCPAHVQP